MTEIVADARGDTLGSRNGVRGMEVEGRGAEHRTHQETGEKKDEAMGNGPTFYISPAGG